jgi:hypothetical protein
MLYLSHTCNLIVHMQHVVPLNVHRNGWGPFLGWNRMAYHRHQRFCATSAQRVHRTEDGAGAIFVLEVLGDPLHVHPIYP